MFKELYVFLIVLIISLVASYCLLNIRAGAFRTIFLRIFFIGVFFHEASHFLMCCLVGVKPDEIKVKWRNEQLNFRDPHGYVKVSKNITFLQGFIIASAPLYLSTWLIFFFWYIVLLNSTIHIIGRILAFFIIISLLLTAAPSTGDLQFISSAFRKNPSHSWYQILLISMSICILWIYLVITQVTFFIDVFYYIAIAVIYLSLKFSFIGIKKLINHLSTLNYSKPSKVKIRPLTHKHYKPEKPPKRL